VYKLYPRKSIVNETAHQIN